MISTRTARWKQWHISRVFAASFIVMSLITLALVSVRGQGRIVFEQRMGGGTWDIFLIRPDGRFRKNLTNGAPNAKHITPTISPDGRMIAFSSNRHGHELGFEIFVMDLVLQNARQITSEFPFLAHLPDWSPDGQKIAYAQCNSDFTNCDIFTISADGTGSPVPLNNSPQDDDNPRFSPDGSKVAFVSNRDGNYEIYVCDADGGNLQRLTDNTVTDGWPSWSPDGRKIIFSSLRDGPFYELYLMNADGSGVTRVTESNQTHNIMAVFSYDGLRVAWSRPISLSFDILEASIESMNQPRRLTPSDAYYLSPDYGFVTRKVGRR